MKPPSGAFLEIIKQAIDTERGGRRFYLDSAKKITHKLARKTLIALAEDEKKHIQALKEFYRNECRLKSCPAARELFRKPHTAARKAILSRPLRAARKLKSLSRVEKIYGVALMLEEEGFNFYQRALKKARTEEEKKLLNFLMEEENNHYHLLLETRDYLEKPREWFLKEEKSIIEG